MALEITRASDNIFRDLGFAQEEAENLRIRAELMTKVRAVIETRGLTQAAAARLFRVTQPRISDLVRGKLHRFSIDGLVAMLRLAGVGVSVTTYSADAENAVVPEGCHETTAAWSSSDVVPSPPVVAVDVTVAPEKRSAWADRWAPLFFCSEAA